MRFTILFQPKKTKLKRQLPLKTTHKQHYLSIPQQNLIHIRTPILHQLAITIEDDEGDFAVAQDRELVSFFHEAVFAFKECDLFV